MSETGAPANGHKFLIHRRGDHVGVATSDIESGETVIGVFLDDDSTVEVQARAVIPLGHKIAIEPRGADAEVLEYGICIGRAPGGFEAGDYVHTHNIRSTRW